jgi:hypothetical protein
MIISAVISTAHMGPFESQISPENKQATKSFSSMGYFNLSGRVRQ